VTTVDPITGVDTNTMKVRSSVGAGVIWDSPFGPIRVDYAFPLSKDPNDRTQELRFSAVRNSSLGVTRATDTVA
jgi:outer membrane protein assembly factor BamA